MRSKESAIEKHNNIPEKTLQITKQSDGNKTIRYGVPMWFMYGAVMES